MVEDIGKKIAKIVKYWADQGLLIEGGWQSYKIIVLPPAAHPTQEAATQEAYYAGAHHMFTSLMSMWEPGEEATANDLHRMDLIDSELQAWVGKMGGP